MKTQQNLIERKKAHKLTHLSQSLCFSFKLFQSNKTTKIFLSELIQTEVKKEEHHNHLHLSSTN